MKMMIYGGGGDAAQRDAMYAAMFSPHFDARLHGAKRDGNAKCDVSGNGDIGRGAM